MDYTIQISDPSQMFPGARFYRAMQAAEQDQSGQTPMPPPTLITGDPNGTGNGKSMLLVAPGQAVPAAGAADIIWQVDVARSLNQIPDFITDFCTGGDLLANSSANVGPVQFVPSPAVIEKATEAAQAQLQVND